MHYGIHDAPEGMLDWDAFHAKYDWRPEPGRDDSTRWYRLQPRRAQAWLENDYTKSATRFDF
jgi:hypothetical protein